MKTQNQENQEHKRKVLNYIGEAVELTNREQRIYSYFREHNNNATTMELVEKCNNTRPSNEIVTMRKKGLKIITTWNKNENTGTIYAIYVLIDKEVNLIE